jgi:hypothetical protein
MRSASITIFGLFWGLDVKRKKRSRSAIPAFFVVLRSILHNGEVSAGWSCAKDPRPAAIP